ncbi:fibroblast growth factor receptor 2-like [Dendronephthya gigantea]|uniref:fibroblast growth factor receptor 2-like n=1 Tax=Dendronephthya gigantea TaxID=151771 RepID=UPI00106C5595|nr:fibroblast growth factor receptor 2-like [Dendronephthya gigantea]
MKSIRYLLTAGVLTFMQMSYAEVSNCSTPISWKNSNPGDFDVYRFRGEWLLVNCAVNTADNATLILRKEPRSTTSEITRVVDNKKIKMAAKNVFNITNVTITDEGRYFCNVCNKKRLLHLLQIIKGNAYLKPSVIIKPNRKLYDRKSIVKLICTFQNTSGKVSSRNRNKYVITWYKLFSNGSQVKRGNDWEMVLDPLKTDEQWKCVISRTPVNYHASQLVNIRLKAQFKPTIYVRNYKQVMVANESEHFLLLYNVSSYPKSVIKWSRSEDGIKYELIYSCPVSDNGNSSCEKYYGKESITNTRFEIENPRFPQDNVSYMINATNDNGRVSKKFHLQVYVKPEIQLEKLHVFEKGMNINCNIKRANPPEVTYTWYSCGTGKCGESNAEWNFELQNSSLRLETQAVSKIRYRCVAKNTAGQDQAETTVLFKSSNNIDTKSSKNTLMFFIVVPSGIITITVLIAISFVLYKRKKIYGGFYLFSYPPIPDYIKNLDENGNIQEQLQKLPFIPEWEFPREKISFISELGSGEFGVVWLSEATGISAFHPRDILKERESRRRFSLFSRTSKRNSYVYCKEVTKVAVKRLKEKWDRNKLIDLKSELKILIHVGENENIVNILGACTKGKSSDLWIIMEYCPYGNLREFLRSSRTIYNMEENSLETDPSQAIGPRNLIHFAWEISKGMDFLISRKIIHRDLAARNILLGQGYTAKVGDFGLARDIYKYQEYLKKSSGLVPLKWMAIESIRDSIYTEKTDMWSFGILLWELFTLGGTPYPGVDVLEVYQTLLNGKRMKPPVHCPQEMNLNEMT